MLLSAWRKERKKSVADHESNELIESYSAQPVTVRVIFDYHAIYKLNSSTLRSVQPLLTDGPHYIFYLFLSMTCSASTLQLLQIFQFLCFIVVITFLAPAGQLVIWLDSLYLSIRNCSQFFSSFQTVPSVKYNLRALLFRVLIYGPLRESI